MIGWVSLVRMYFVLSGSLPPVVSVFLSVGWHADGTGHRERDIDVVGFPPTLVCFPADKRLACLAVCHRTRRSIKTEHCARTGGNRRSGRRILDSTLLRKMEAAESLASGWRRRRDQTAGCSAHHQSIVAASGWRYWPRSPRLPPGRAGAQLDRRAAMDGGLGCRVDVVLIILFLVASLRQRPGAVEEEKKKEKKKQPVMANSACGVGAFGAFVVGRVPASSTAGRVPEPIVGGSAIQLSGSRQSPPIMAGARRWTAWDSMDSTGSVWLMNAICRPLTGHSGRSLRGQWMLTGRPVSRPRARGPPLSQAPGKASWHAWAALADPSSSPQSHCWTAGAKGHEAEIGRCGSSIRRWAGGVCRPLKRERTGLCRSHRTEFVIPPQHSHLPPPPLQSPPRIEPHLMPTNDETTSLFVCGRPPFSGHFRPLPSIAGPSPTPAPSPSHLRLLLCALLCLARTSSHRTCVLRVPESPPPFESTCRAIRGRGDDDQTTPTRSPRIRPLSRL